ncbi:hypothetical protein JCGZ_18331 [Jatropha curcas]|uniref:Uncharacterized protein n=1 Tax=Jatropha curcas TaxID=180498 RepID=A0A067KAX1_JATCU|nr:uncharacterized protein LOC105642031 [Jatropha curcas]KDP29410.1 hypothetical protein JCGZ_18331 [Jatropha curcas]
MKRQRNVEPQTRASKAMAKKKGKRVVEELEEERKNGACGGGEPSTGVVESCLNWEELAWLRRGVVDEQMSWGSIWLPFWDVEYMGEACSEMFSDVVWDYDIWNLKSIQQVPNP